MDSTINCPAQRLKPGVVSTLIGGLPARWYRPIKVAFLPASGKQEAQAKNEQQETGVALIHGVGIRRALDGM